MARDWIPAGETTPNEAIIIEKQRRGGARGLVVDFIPGPGFEVRPPSGAKKQADEAVERAMRRQEYAIAEEWDAAVENLKKMTVAQAATFIASAPFAVQELYLTAELEHGNRKSLLDRFPEPDPATRDKYLLAARRDSTPEVALATEGAE